MKTLIILQESDTENFSIEELILAQAELRTIDNGFQELKLETPEWVVDKLTEAGNEINLRIRGELARRLKAAKARRSALRSRSELRNDIIA